MRLDHALKAACVALAESDTARLDAEVLLAHAIEKNRTFLYTWPERELTEAQQNVFKALIARRAEGEPIAYITGTQEFWSLPLLTSAHTLIPRPETELLVEQALQLELPEAAQVLDLGTGTGAIALALASEKPRWNVQAVDRIAESVELAKSNARRLKLPVTVLQSFWFKAIDGTPRFDLIVSNPPYIDADDTHLLQGDVRFEPASALVADEQGLSDIRHIAAEAFNYLNASGWLLLEHGWQQGEAVRRVLEHSGFRQVETVRDLAGHERITIGQR